jgi:hypothetical protein
MVIITAAINNQAPSHIISSLGALGDLARATGGTFPLRIDFTCTPKIVKGRREGRPCTGTAFPASPQSQLPIERIMACCAGVCRCSGAIGSSLR